MFQSPKISALVHFLAFAAGNGAVLAFVPAQYKELATLIGNFVVGFSAWYDTSYGSFVSGKI